MCGLVGVVSNSLTFQTNKVFKQLLYMDALRGPHSTGVATDNKDNEVSVYKRALMSSDFLQLDAANTLINSISGSFLMGHNRYATQGSINDDNAHPFTYGNVTLCHNGTLTDQTTLPDHEDFEVDSENIAWAMGLAKEPEEVISKLHGAFALTWYNDHELKFYIVRNSERPMWYAIDKEKSNYYYASERFMLEAALTRNSIKYDIKEVKAGELLTFDMSKTNIELTISTVKLAPKKVIASPMYQSWNIKSYKASNPLSSYNLKIGDEVEFYTHGLPDVVSSKTLGTLLGVSTCKVPMTIKCYAQPNDSIAGYYTGIVQSVINDKGKDILIIREPWLAEIIEGDVNNVGRPEIVDKILSKDAALASTINQRAFR